MNDANDIPEVVTQPGADILPFLPPEMQKWALLALVLLPYLTRSWHALTSGGGISGAWKAIWFGTNTPKDTKSANAGKVTSLILAGFLCFGASAMVQGCKTSPPAVMANISDSAKVTADAALAAWNDYIPVGRPSLEQQQKVKDAWLKYKAAQLVLLDAAILYAETGKTGTSQQKFDAAIAASSQALADLVGLIREFGVKLE